LQAEVVSCRSSSGEEADEEGLEAFHPELQKDERERERERERFSIGFG
jgi:hypothetical protein